MKPDPVVARIHTEISDEFLHIGALVIARTYAPKGELDKAIKTHISRIEFLKGELRKRGVK